MMVTNPIADYIRKNFRALLMLDHALCLLIGGPPGHTLSGYAWDAEQRGKLWPKVWRPTIDKLAGWVFGQVDHCRKAWIKEEDALRLGLDPLAYTN